MKVFALFLVLTIVGSSEQPLPGDHLGKNDQPLPNGGWKNQPGNNQPLPNGGWKNQPLPNGGWKNQPLPNGDGKNQPLPNGDWKNQPLPNGGWKNQPLPNGDWKNLLNQPLPNNDWQKTVQNIFPPEPQNGKDDSDDIVSTIENIVNNVVNSVTLPPWTKTNNDIKVIEIVVWLNTSTVSELEDEFDNETASLHDASKQCDNALTQYKAHLNDTRGRQANITCAQNTLIQLLKSESQSDSLTVLAITSHFLASLQLTCDQYNVSQSALNYTIQTLNVNCINIRSQLVQNRIWANTNHSKKIDQDYESLQIQLSGALSNIDASQITLNTIRNIYSQSLFNLSQQRDQYQRVVDLASSNIFIDVDDWHHNLSVDANASSKIEKDYQDQLPLLHERFLSVQASLDVVNEFSVNIELEVDYDNLTEDGILEFESDSEIIIRGYTIYRFSTRGSCVNVTKVGHGIKRDGGNFQNWVASLNQSGDIQVNVSAEVLVQISDSVSNDSSKWIATIQESTDLSGKISDLSVTIDHVTNSNKNLKTQINNAIQNLKKDADKINQAIQSYVGSLLEQGDNEEDIVTSVFGHDSAVLNSTIVTLQSQLNVIYSSLLDANLTVLEIQYNLTQVISQLSQTTDPTVKTTLQIEQEVYSTALTQAMKTLAVLESAYQTGNAQLLQLEEELQETQNKTNIIVHRLQEKQYNTIHQIRQLFRTEKDAILSQIHSSLESLLNCTVDQDSINGLNDTNDNDSISFHWGFHFDLSVGETINDKIPTIQIVIQKLLVAQAVVDISTIQVTVTPSSKRAAGDLSASASVSSTPSTTSSSTNPTTSGPMNYTPVIIGCVVGGVILIIIVAVVLVLLKKKGDERV